ncbi:hypothetical protein B0H21DRAFT_835882 [Amylocystis lapponica]|nr:hypothetical protein B0H21DRAFT_835882 [Amylocystis lapponica]
MDKPIIAVVGATGTQGQSVCAAFNGSGTWKVRALTRNPSGPIARRYATQNIEVVKATFENKASLVKAFKGATAVATDRTLVLSFCIMCLAQVYAMSIPAWGPEPRSSISELDQGTNQADAAKAAGVRFLLWSTLPYVGPVFKDKAMVDEYIRAIGLPAVFLSLSPFVESILDVPLIRWGDDGTKLETQNFVVERDRATPMLWTEHDLGPSALAIANALHSNGPSVADHPWNHSAQPIASFRCSFADISRCVEEITGIPVIHAQIVFSAVIYSPTGMASGTQIVRRSPRLAKELVFQNSNGYHAEIAVFPRRELANLAVRYGTLEEFVRQKIVPLFGRDTAARAAVGVDSES